MDQYLYRKDNESIEFIHRWCWPSGIDDNPTQQ